MKYLTVNDYIKNIFGYKMYKVSLNISLSCPNRDGFKGRGGCIFCSQGGSGDFASDHKKSVTEQIEEGKTRVVKKLNLDPKDQRPHYIAYFQAFTNTYGPIDYLRECFFEAANHKDIAIISIATRPDCLGPEVLELLDELNQMKPVWVEMGLQTIHPKTADMINRCYPLSDYEDAIKNLKEREIKTITHLILGLPGETVEDMLESVDYVASRSWGIKLAMLHVLEGTRLGEIYKTNPFHVFHMDEYIDLVCQCVKRLPEDMVIHRLTGDGPKNLLIAPKWSGNKRVLLNKLRQRLSNMER